MNINIASDSFLENKYIIGIVMIIVNIGARFIVNELDDSQKSIVNSKYLRRILIFCVILLATRDLTSSIVLTIIVIFFIFELFNENSEFSLIPKNENNKTKEKNNLDKNQKIDMIIEELKTL